MSVTTSEAQIALTGKSGKQYQFTAYPRHFTWNEVPGVYVILRNTSSGTVLYVGETENLKDRMANHHKQACFDRNGWTHLGWLGERSSTRRLEIESDLMLRYRPTCNDQV
ncbi:MAG: GIY-YIG nuclease family protein [Gemmatimonadetes bacterium]|nr:GIY-YIG nuclease family protein [Gemmatimonadota bacterium]